MVIMIILLSLLVIASTITTIRKVNRNDKNTNTEVVVSPSLFLKLNQSIHALAEKNKVRKVMEWIRQKNVEFRAMVEKYLTKLKKVESVEHITDNINESFNVFATITSTNYTESVTVNRCVKLII